MKHLLAFLVCVSAIAAPSTANLWVDSNGGTCTRNSTAAAYVDAAACASISAAWSAASSGDIIVIKAGTYGAQSVSGNKTSDTKIYGEATTTIGTFSVGVNYLWLEDVTINPGDTAHDSGWQVSGDHVTFKNVKAWGRYVAGYISAGTDYFTWDGGQWGEPGNLGSRNCTNADGYYLYMLGDSAITNIVLRGINVQPQKVDTTACGGDPLHAESIRIDGNIDTMLIDRLNFVDGGQNNTGTIFLTTFRGGPPTNITIQNSYFGTDGNSSIVFGGTGLISNSVIQYNTISSGISYTTGTPVNLITRGNAGWMQSFATCAGTHTKNVWQWSQSFTCGTDTVVIGTQYSLSALGLANGYEVQTGSPLINAGEASCAPTTDIRGYTRPTSGTNCDAGAFEYGASPAGGGTAPTITSTSPLAAGTVGVAYSQSLAATGDATITWSVTSGSLPAGLSLSSGGAITGTPTTAGTSTPTITATNGTGSDAKAFSITISAAATASAGMSGQAALSGKVTLK